MSRFCLAIVLSFSLAGAPAWAAAKPLGMVTVADKAHVEGSNASIGADIYAGDSLDTDPGGTLRVKAGSTQLYLASQSAATFNRRENQVQVNLVRGTLGFSSAQAGQFEVQTPIGTVRAADGQRAFGEVTITGQNKILVASYHGALVVKGNGVERTVNEGDAYNVSLADPPPPADPNSPSPKPAMTSGAVGLIVFSAVTLGVAAGVGYAIWHYTNESDPNPQH